MHLSRTKTENPAAKKFIIRFSIDNFIANIKTFALCWAKLNFGYYLTFEIILKALKPENSAFLMQIARFDRLSNPISRRIVIVSYF